MNGWILSVIDQETKDQAFKLFIETKTKANCRIDDIKKRYDTLIKDRFKVVVSSPYCELDEAQLEKITIIKNNQNSIYYLSVLSNFDPILISETPEQCIIEIKSKYSEEVLKLLEAQPREELL